MIVYLEAGLLYALAYVSAVSLIWLAVSWWRQWRMGRMITQFWD